MVSFSSVTYGVTIFLYQSDMYVATNGEHKDFGDGDTFDGSNVVSSLHGGICLKTARAASSTEDFFTPPRAKCSETHPSVDGRMFEVGEGEDTISDGSDTTKNVCDDKQFHRETNHESEQRVPMSAIESAIPAHGPERKEGICFAAENQLYLLKAQEIATQVGAGPGEDFSGKDYRILPTDIVLFPRPVSGKSLLLRLLSKNRMVLHGSLMF